MTIWSGAVEAVRPVRGSAEGPLPPLLLLLTVVTGLGDPVGGTRRFVAIATARRLAAA